MHIKIPPLALILLSFALMWCGDKYISSGHFNFPFQTMVSIVLLLAGLIVTITGARTFKRAETTLNPLNLSKSTSLVSHGIFNYTRNPMYLGMLLGLSAFLIYFGSIWNLFVLLLIFLQIRFFQIRPEEAAMRKLFGEEYSDYGKRVRRWF